MLSILNQFESCVSSANSREAVKSCRQKNEQVRATFCQKRKDMKEKMMYISTNILNQETDVTLVDNLWGKSSFGMPDWGMELKNICSKNGQLDAGLFFSGPWTMKGDLQKECKKLNIDFHQGDF